MIVTGETVSTTIIGESVESGTMGFDPEGAAHIMSMLSSMYEDEPQSVLREYTSNARDSHVAAGNPDPVHVTLPSALHPTLTIEDWGLGLSLDEVRDVYSRYGASTKRDSNNQIGGFGIGAKSAFTVGSQFTVTATKNGETTITTFSLDGDDTPVFDVAEHFVSDAPNGVRVDIAVRDPHLYVEAAERCFATWPRGTVLVNGVEPTPVFEKMTKVADGMWVTRTTPSSKDGGLTLVMGGVGYRVTDTLVAEMEGVLTERLRNHIVNGSIKLVFEIGIGEVHLTPSREGVRSTPLTRSRVQRALNDYAETVTSTMGQRVDAVDHPTAAAVLAAEAERMLPGLHLTWRGKEIPDEVVVPLPSVRLDSVDPPRRSSVREAFTLWMPSLTSRDTPLVVVTGVTGDNHDSVLGAASRFLAHWTGRDGEHLDCTNAWLSLAADATLKAAAESSPFFDLGPGFPFPTVTAQEVIDFVKKSKKSKKASSTGPRPSQTVSYETTTGSMTVDAIVAAGKPVLTMVESEKTSIKLATVWGVDLNAHTLVSLTARQSHDTFVRRIGGGVTVTPLHEVVRDKANAIVSALPEEQRVALAARGRYPTERTMKFLDPDQTYDDPDLALLARLKGISVDHLRQAVKVSDCGLGVDVSHLDKCWRRYPLFEYMPDWGNPDLDEVRIYLNAAYAEHSGDTQS